MRIKFITYLEKLECCTYLDKLFMTSVDDFGGFQVVDTVLIGRYSYNGPIFSMNIDVDLVVLARIDGLA